MPIATIITKKTKRLAVMFSFFFFSSRFNVSYVQQCINELVSFLFFFSLPINVSRIHCTLFISIKLRFFSFFFLAFYVFTIIQCSVCTTNCSSMRAIHEFSSLHFSIAFKPIHFFQLWVSLLIHYWRSFIADNHCNKFWSKEFPNFLFFSSFLSVCFELKRKKKKMKYECAKPMNIKNALLQYEMWCVFVIVLPFNVFIFFFSLCRVIHRPTTDTNLCVYCLRFEWN